MWGYRFAKNALKYAAGWTAATGACVRDGRLPGQACIFAYHRVADVRNDRFSMDNWNVSPNRLEQHLRWVAQEADCVPLAQLRGRVRSGAGSRPLVALTFDDGFANFEENVLPLLRRYGVPATVNVVTRYVGSESPFPFDLWGQKIQSRTAPIAWRPISWEALETCVHSGLVSVASHSHNHFMAFECTDDELAEEASMSGQLIRTRLGKEQGDIFCYPYGCSRLGEVPPRYVAAVRRAGYSMALTTDLGLIDRETSPLLLPRVEAHGWDSPSFLRAKADGHLVGLRLLQFLRKERHFWRPACGTTR